MPISIDEFEAHDTDSEPTNAERVLRFLARNREQAYKATEIAEETGVNRNSIHPVLMRLEAQNLVRHREPYWAIGDPDAVRSASVFHEIASFLDDELGPERRAEWIEAAERGE